IPTHESEQRRRLSPPAARAAPPASPRPFPQPDPSPQSPSSVTSLCRVLACKVAAPPNLSRWPQFCVHPVTSADVRLNVGKSSETLTRTDDVERLQVPRVESIPRHH